MSQEAKGVSKRTKGKRVIRLLKVRDPESQKNSVFQVVDGDRSQLLMLRSKHQPTMYIQYGLTKAASRVIKEWAIEAEHWRSRNVTEELGAYTMTCEPMVRLSRIDDPSRVQYLSPIDMRNGLENLSLQ